jgi:hypothetical protein
MQIAEKPLLKIEASTAENNFDLLALSAGRRPVMEINKVFAERTCRALTG